MPWDFQLLLILIGFGFSIWLIVLFVRLYYRVTQIRDALFVAFDLEDCVDPYDRRKWRYTHVRRRQRQGGEA